MEEIRELLNQRMKLLKRSIKKAERDAEKFPAGSLRLSRNGKWMRYYHVTELTQPFGEYIPKSNRSLVRKLAQKDYNSRFRKYAKKELRVLEKVDHILAGENANLSYQNLSKYRKDLVIPYIQEDEDYAAEWQEKYFLENEFHEDEKIYDTKRGEKVRSKSEAILADMFYELGIPYHYEKELVLSDGRSRYPDFTLLQLRTKTEIYWEHFGLLENEEYRHNTIQKLDEYRKSGIFVGKNLLFSYETSQSPLDIKGIRKMVGDLFLK